MHPLFHSNRSFLMLAGLWTLLCILIAIGLMQLAQGQAAYWPVLFVQFVPWFFLLLFFSTSNVYLCQRLPLASSPVPVLLSIHGLAALLSIGLWLLLGLGWSYLLTELGWADSLLYFHRMLPITGLLGLLVYGLWLLVHYSYLGMRAEEDNNARALSQQLLVSSIELQALRATIHPHFLYNSLNTLANLSLTSPGKIHSLCIQMSDFLRYSVNYGQRHRVTVQDELQHVQNYLAVEQERFGDKLQLSVQAETAALALTLPPLLLFPLVENAIKHGIGSQLEPGFVSLAIACGADTLTLQISNSYDPEGQKAMSTGHGLSSLKKRLQRHYGDAARLELEKTADQFSARLQLPIQRTALLEPAP